MGLIKYYVKLIANPLGDLAIEWKIPLHQGVKEYALPCPYFKYEMPFVLGIPIPISSIAHGVEVEIVKCVMISPSNTEKQKQINNVEIRKIFGGNKEIKIVLEEDLCLTVYKHLVLQIKAKNFINKDPVFLNFCYAITNPFRENAIFNIELTARFAYLIRGYRIYCHRCKTDTGEKIERISNISVKRIGDIIKVNKEDIPISPNEEVDIFLTGSRLPRCLSIPRALFWVIIFIITLGVIMLPLISLIISSLK